MLVRSVLTHFRTTGGRGAGLGPPGGQSHRNLLPGYVGRQAPRRRETAGHDQPCREEPRNDWSCREKRHKPGVAKLCFP